jgi:hypothetical protein
MTQRREIDWQTRWLEVTITKTKTFAFFCPRTSNGFRNFRLARHVLVDSTNFTTLFGGTDSLQNFWRNFALMK